MSIHQKTETGAKNFHSLFHNLVSILKVKRNLISLIVPIVFLGLWEITAIGIDNHVVLPRVQYVFALLLNPTEGLIGMGSLASNTAISLTRVLSGYFFGVILGTSLGVLMGYYYIAFNLLNSFLGLFRPIPPLAWVPLVLSWFGVASFATILGVTEGDWYVYLNNLQISMVFIIFIGAFFPIITSTIYGVRNVNKTLIDSARVLGANEREVFFKVLLPASAPSIVNGMRIGMGVAWMCLVSAEMLPGTLSGIGYLITHGYTLARTDIVIAGMITIGVVGALMDMSFRVLEDRKFKWQRLAR